MNLSQNTRDEEKRKVKFKGGNTSNLQVGSNHNKVIPNNPPNNPKEIAKYIDDKMKNCPEDFYKYEPSTLLVIPLILLNQVFLNKQVLL